MSETRPGGKPANRFVGATPASPAAATRSSPLTPSPHHPITLAPLPPIDTVHLFPGERAALLALLDDLSPADWDAPTVCAGWSVKDAAAHLLGDDIGRVSRGRDGYVDEAFAAGLDIATLPGLVAAIDRQNAVWGAGARRMSPRLLMELLQLTGDWTQECFASLDLDALGMSVEWAGPDPAPVWLDVAREYTERWHHQQHIRDAVHRPGLKERRWFAPVLDTFVRGLPRALANASASEGTTVRLMITGEAGGEWVALRERGGWRLGRAPEVATTATLALDQEVAWRLFTKGITKDDARRSAVITGDAALAERALETVSILA